MSLKNGLFTWTEKKKESGMRDMEKHKEPKGNKEQKENEGNTAHKFLIPFACISVIIFFGANLFLAVLWGVKGLPDGCSGQASLLSTGIGIIGFAIATWAGLNISNIISQKNFNKLEEKVQNLNKELDGLKGISELELRPFVEQNRAALLQQFLVELERAQDDPIAQYFFKQFRSISTEENDIPYTILIEIETLIAQVALRHRSAYVYDKTLIALADKGLGRIDEIQGCKKIKWYLIYRKADFMFYKGYCDRDQFESAKDFLRSANNLTKEPVYDFFKAALSDNERASAYLDNMLGEAYSKVVQYYANIYGTEAGTNLEQFIENRGCQIDKLADLAIKYCEAAVDRWATSMYCRNLGCAYERRERLTVLNGGKKFTHKTEIIGTYLRAVSETMNDYILDRETIRKAFYVLLMYYQKYLEDQIENCNYLHETCKRCAGHISNMYSHAYIAKLEFPRCLVFQKLYIFSCYYVVQALSANVRIDAAHGKARKYFERQIEDTMKLLGYLDDADGKRDTFTKKIKSISKTIRSI